MKGGDNMIDQIQTELKDVTNNLFWLFMLQGVSFIALGILVYHYPAIILGLVVAGFIWTGLSALVTGWKIKKFSKKIETLALA